MNFERIAADGGAATTTGRRARLLRNAPLAALSLELLVAGTYLVATHRRLWFFGDDWDFFLNRGIRSDPVHALFDAHNEHWSTLPVIVFRILFAWFGVAHYLPYAVVVVTAHLGVCIVLWVLLRRVAVNPWLAVGLIGLVALLIALVGDLPDAHRTGYIGSFWSGCRMQRWTAIPKTKSSGKTRSSPR